MTKLASRARLPAVGLFILAGAVALFLPSDIAAFHVRVPIAIFAFLAAIGLAFWDQSQVRAMRKARVRMPPPRRSRPSSHLREERPGWR